MSNDRNDTAPGAEDDAEARIVSVRTGSCLLWQVAWPGCDEPDVFIGTEAAVIPYINARHRATGLEHAARELRP